MPNWCENVMSIQGDTRKINEIIGKLSGEDGIFNALVGKIPMSEDEYEKGGWWEGNISYWGTKWDVQMYEVQSFLNDNETVLSFWSAWSPPIQFCQKLSEKYNVIVNIEYSESGCDFAGKVEIDNGNIVSEESYPYLEGLYRIIDKEMFWNEVEFLIENDYDTEFDFVSEEDKEEINKMKQAKKIKEVC